MRRCVPQNPPAGRAESLRGLLIDAVTRLRAPCNEGHPGGVPPPMPAPLALQKAPERNFCGPQQKFLVTLFAGDRTGLQERRQRFVVTTTKTYCRSELESIDRLAQRQFMTGRKRCGRCCVRNLSDCEQAA